MRNHSRIFGSHPCRQLALLLIYRRTAVNALRLLARLREAEFASPQNAETKQFQSVQKLLEHAGEKVPYYRQLFSRLGIRASDIRSLADLCYLPVLTKDTLQEHGNELADSSQDIKGARPNASGGSTGTPVQFCQDDKYWSFAQASQWFVESWWGVHPGDRTASIWGCDRDLPELGWKEQLRMSIEQVRICNAFALSEAKMIRFAEMLTRWRPTYINGYASALELFSRFLLSHPELRIRPNAVKSTAETLTDAQRSVIEQAFQAPVYNFYGSREINNLAAECLSHEGLHINSLGRYIELIDENGKPVAAGKPGRVIVTDLTNLTMPFIRYEIGDVASWRGAPCSCGRSFPLLERVWGRSSDFITTPEGKLIHGEFFTHLFYGTAGVEQFQVVQPSMAELNVNIVISKDTEASPLASLTKRVSEAMGPGVECRIRIVDKIDRSVSGKHRFTVSHVPVRWAKAEIQNREKTGALLT